MRRWIRRLCAAGAGFLFVICPEQAPAQEPDYDIVYVRWPRRGTEILLLPQAEDPYRVEPGADLVLLHPDQSEEVLVDCDTCCVQDPTISFDGEWVYYTKMLDARNERSPSLLFKMHIAGPNADRKELQLTYADGFTGSFHSGNNHPDDNLAHHFSIRDMGPAPIPGGRIVFTSNRQATIAFRQGSAFSVSDARDSSVMQLYVMDDHDGRLRTSDLSNLRQVGFGSLHMTLHPMVLQDGRIAFSNWDDGGGKFLYAMTTLYVMNPDGSHLEALTEPHDHHKNVDHFATQLSDGSIVVAQYYPSFNFGFGHLCRFPMNVDEPAYTRSPSKAGETYTGGQISFRNFDRKGWVSVTPHTSPSDCPAPNFSGKYCMPCAAPRGSCLVAYSPGGVNHNLTCSEGKIQVVDSGIYLIPDAVNGAVYDPRDSRQLVEIVNDPRYNEIWPRAVVPYMEVHGVREPRRLAWHDAALPEDDRVAPGEPVAVVGTSSLYNRESAPLGGDPFRASDGRELHSGAWTLQGSEAGVIKNSDIYAVRLIAVSPKPFRSPISRFGANSEDHAAARRYLYDRREDTFVEGYASAHSERWKILAEIPVRKRDAGGNVVLDGRGDPDTSFAVKIPANTPFFFQGIDKNGMTLFSELTWRSAVPGEDKTNCGGCHAHSIARLDFSETAAGRHEAIHVEGVGESDPLIAGGLWDATVATPLIAGGATPSLAVAEHGALDVEFHRDVKPILQARCVGCHATRRNASGTDLAFDGKGAEDDAYFRLVQDHEGFFGAPPPGGPYIYPQLTRYVRANQARQSLLIWKLYGTRLDGRNNGDRDDDIDFTPHTQPHGATPDEMQTIARWVDLGCPIDFSRGAHAGYRYTDDNLLPVLVVSRPLQRGNVWMQDFDGTILVGATDVESGVDWKTLSIELDTDLSDGVNPQPVPLAALERAPGASVAKLLLSQELPLEREMMLVVSVKDAAGNRNRDARRFWLGLDRDSVEDDAGANEPPPPPTSGGNGSVSKGGGGGGGGCIARAGPENGWMAAVWLVLLVCGATWGRRIAIRGRD